MTLRHFEKNRLVEYESAQSGMPDAHHERHVEYQPRVGLQGSTTGFSCGAVSSARTSSGGRLYRR